MKKFIFGCVLMVSGILGGTGWVLAHAIMASSHGWDSLSHLFNYHLGGWWSERFFIIVFYAIAIVGASIVVKVLKENKYISFFKHHKVRFRHIMQCTISQRTKASLV